MIAKRGGGGIPILLQLIAKINQSLVLFLLLLSSQLKLSSNISFLLKFLAEELQFLVFCIELEFLYIKLIC